MKPNTLKALLICTIVSLTLITSGGGFVAAESAVSPSPPKVPVSTEDNVTLLNQTGGAVYGAATRGNYAYVGIGPRLVVMNISNPQNPIAIGQTDVFPGTIVQVTLDGDYAYVAELPPQNSDEAGLGGLRIIDISDPTQPQAVGFCDTPWTPQSVSVSGDYAYVSDGLYGLRIIDVSIPSSPTEVKVVPETPGTVTTLHTAIAGNYAYVAESDGGLRVLNISDPTSPTTVYQYTSRSVYSVAVVGQYAYLGSLYGSVTGTFVVLNISNPAAPVEVGTTTFSETPYWIEVVNSRAYVASGVYGNFLTTINVSNPNAPSVLGEYQSHIGSQGAKVTIHNNTAYWTTGYSGLFIMDISDPTDPTYVKTYEAISATRNLQVADGYAYIGLNNDHAFIVPQDPQKFATMIIADLSSPDQPEVVGAYQGYTDFGNFAVSGDYAYIVEPKTFDSTGLAPGGVRILAVSNPAIPAAQGFYDTLGSGSTSTMMYGIAHQGDYAYIGDGSGADNPETLMHVVNTTNPMSPQATGYYTTTPGNVSDVYDIAISGTYAYVGTGDRVDIVDISNPAAPSRTGVYTATYFVRDVAVAGNYLYVGLWETFMCIVDISDPANPVEISKYRVDNAFGFGTEISNIEVSGDYAYIAHSDGLHIADISDPYNPFEVENYRVSDEGAAVAVDGSTIYLSSRRGGLYILEFTPPSDISGLVIDTAGNPLEEVLISAGASYTATTDATGAYTITDVPAGTYTLTPSKAGVLRWDPAERTITVPSTAMTQDFTGHYTYKTVAPSEFEVAEFGEVLTYTIRVTDPEATTVSFYDPVPAYTAYVADSLTPTSGLTYDAGLDAITGTLEVSATTPVEVTFAVRVGITGTIGLAPPVTNRACVFPVGQTVDDCVWSNTVTNKTYVWRVFLPLVMRNTN